MKTSCSRFRLFVFAFAAALLPLRAANESPSPAASDLGNTAGQISTSSGKVDINTADSAALEKLPGIGTEFANAIIASRPYKSVDDLARVPGLGPERIKALRGRVTASAVKPTASKPDASRVSEASRPATVNAGKAISRDAVTESYERTVEKNSARTNERPRDEHGRFVSSPGAADRVNLNTATKEELEALPEIGPVKAQAIIDARPFSKAEEVMRVSGIKTATYEAIKDKITVR